MLFKRGLVYSLTLSTQILIISIKIYALKALVLITPAYTDKAEVGFTMLLCNTTESGQRISVPVTVCLYLEQ